MTARNKNIYITFLLNFLKIRCSVVLIRKFLHFLTKFVSVNLLDQTNKKWFLNLTDKTIAPIVSNLLQMGSKFSFPDSHNKVHTIKEFIEDIKSCLFQNKII